MIRTELDLEIVSFFMVIYLRQFINVFFMFVDQANSGGQGQRKCGLCKQTGNLKLLIYILYRC